MSYEKDLDYLKRELRNAQNIYDEAEENERESDAEMWMNRVTHLEFQIEVFEKATKADEYEAKAKAWDKLSASIRGCNKEIELKGGLNAMFRTSKKGQIVQRHIDCFESGGYDAEK